MQRMVKPSSSKATTVEELVSSVQSNVEVVRDALKAPPTEESHALVQEMMLDLKQSQEKLQKEAADMAESGKFDNTNDIFEAIDQVTHLEPDFGAWSNNQDILQIGANIHVEEKAKKKKKKKRKDTVAGEAQEDHQAVVPAIVQSNGAASWEAFPPPPAAAFEWPAQQATQPKQEAGRITLGMSWDVVGPLLGDPGSSDQERKNRLAQLVQEAISNECKIPAQRVRITRIS